ncbi:MAG: hypothetical protein SGI77_20595 [Pirellulaceae bacterium]|nr:hypothetical protein [Pirellulaceae bacterium]
MSNPKRNIETRVAVYLAIGRYLRAASHFEAASREFNEACEGVRSQLAEPSRFIAKVDFKHFLVTSDRERNFEVEELELI